MRADNSHLDTKNDNDFNGSQKSMIGFRAFDLVPETVNLRYMFDIQLEESCRQFHVYSQTRYINLGIVGIV